MKYKLRSIKLLPILIFFSLSVLGQQHYPSDDGEKTYRIAKELFSEGKYASALNEFENLRKITGTENRYSDEIDYYIPVCYLELGNAEGRSRLKYFMESHPESPLINQAYFRLGNADFKLKQYKQALNEYKKTDKNTLSGNELDEYYFNSGFCYLEQGNTAKAKDCFAKLNDKTGPYYESSEYYKAHIDFLEGNYTAALTEFQKLENSKEYSSVIPLYKARIYFAQGKYLQVVEIAPPLMDKASEKQKDELSRMLGISYYQLEKYNDAIPYIDNYLKYKGITNHEYYAAGYCYGKTGQTDKAIINFEKSISGKDSLSQNAYYQLAGLYIKKNDKQRAMVALQNASNMNFDPKIRENALFQYAKITYELDYSPFNEAINAFDRYISEYPNSENNEVAYEYLSKVFMTTRNYKDALTSLEKIKVKSPDIKKAYQHVSYNRGIELFRDLNFTEAVKLFTKSLEYGQYDGKLKSLAYYWRGEANFRLGKNDEAIADYNKFQSLPGSTKEKNFPFPATV